MSASPPTDEVLLAARDAASFETFYLRHVEALLVYFVRRTGDPELAADLTAETFAAALAARRRFKPARGSARGWLFGIAANKLADARRRGHAESRARRRLGMERLELDDAVLRAIDALAGPAAATAWLEDLADEQRDAVYARVIEGRSYEEIARAQHVSEAAVRQRVHRGLAAVRRRLGAEP